MTDAPRQPACFTCAKHKPLVPGHVVCADCHALSGRCGRCGFLRRGQKSRRLKVAGQSVVYPEQGTLDPNRLLVRA